MNVVLRNVQRAVWASSVAALATGALVTGLQAEESADVKPKPVADVPPADTAMVSESDLAGDHPVVREAKKLARGGRSAEATQILETFLVGKPEHKQARQLYLRLRIEERKAEMRSIVEAVVEDRRYILPNPAYESAKAISPAHISQQLDMVEHLVYAQKFRESVELCEQILVNHPDNEAAMILLHRTLDYMVKVEKRQLERERDISNELEMNDVIRRGSIPRMPPKMPRTVLVFPEDINEIERQKLIDQLQTRIKLMKFEAQPLEDILKQLFAVAGLNFIMLDSAIAEETLTLDLVDETVEHVLEIVQRMVTLQFNYQGGSVYVTSSDNPIMVTEIIRLKYGLSDVLKAPEIPNLGGGGGGGGDDAGGGGDLFQGGGEEGSTDLERFLEEALVADGLVDWPEGSKYYLDKKMNALVVRSTPASIREIKRLVEVVDRPALQVLIEAKFVEVSTEAVRNVGVNWNVMAQQQQGSNPANNLFFGLGSGTAANPVDALTNPQAFGQQFGSALATSNQGLIAGIVGSGPDLLPNFSVQLNLLQQRGQANLLSEPKILTLNNATGIIDVRQDISFVQDFQQRSSTNNGTAVDGSDQDGTVLSSNVLVPQFETEQEGIQLRVQPSIAINSDLVTLNITPTVREFTGFAGAGDQQIGGGTSVLGTAQVTQPQFSTRRLFTSLNVKNGQTIVLGGLVRENDTSNNSGLPGLADVPGIGRLFRRDSDDMRRSKLLVFLTVHIIDPTGAEYSDEIQHLRDQVRVALPADIKEEQRDRQRSAADAAAERAAKRSEEMNKAERANRPSPTRKGRGK